MAKIFISYRRDDCRDHVERIHDRLVRDLKGHKIFLDVDNIPGASHYEIILKDAVTECDVFLAIMGENWVDVSDPHTGQKRLLDPNDFVRIEVETALQNNRTKVIPVIAHDAQIPQPGELPEPIRELVKLQFIRVRRNPDFHRDMDNLVNTVREYLPREQRISPFVFLGSIAAAVLATVLVMYLFLGGEEPPEKIVETLNPSAVAVVLLTSAAETADAPTLTPTIDITQTINAIMQGIITEQATKLVVVVPTDTPTERPTLTQTPMPTPTATFTQDKTATAAVQNTQTQLALAATGEHATQESQLIANAPTNTPRPTATVTRTATATRTATPTLTPTPSATWTATPNLTQTYEVTATQIAQVTQVYEQAVATLDSQLAATAAAAIALQQGELVYHVDEFTESDRDRELVSVYLDGSSPINLTANGADDLNPNWSSDGQRIVFETVRRGQRDIFMLDLTTGSEIPLTNDTRVDFSPVWSPDGSQVLYYAYENPQSRNQNIYIFDLATGEITQLTTDGGSYQPDWSPDGSQIIYVSERTAQGEARSPHLYIMDADGGNPHSLGGQQPIFGTAPDWSPDGTEVVFVGTDAELYIVDVDGSNLRPLTQNNATNLEPAWSADSRWIAFESNMNNDFDIYLVDRQGNNLYQVTLSALNEHAPTWNPYTQADYVQTLPQCPQNLPGRLVAGQRGRVISEVDLRIRPQPGLVEGEVGKMPRGSEFTVLEGPECADRFTWWKVDYQGVVGWVSEGRGVTYWVEPIKR